MQLEKVATLPTIRLGMRLYLQTMVRKSELQDATWDEVDFENAVWTIPKERMKRSKAHNVYLSRQVLDIFIALKICAGNSRYVLPSRYDSDAPMSRATFNRVTYLVVEQAKKEGLPLAPFTVHDLRRTDSTLLNELGFNRGGKPRPTLSRARREAPGSTLRVNEFADTPAPPS
jgi:integrase